MGVSTRLKEKLQTLPDKPGVYFMRDRQGKIIYVGKAASLRDRVRSYFHAATLRSADPKLRSLVHTIADFEFLVTRTEAEAVITEGRLIKEYRPRYNVSFRDDKRFLMIRVDPAEPWPRFDAVRLRKNDGAVYFGPYASTQAARAALEFLDKRLGLRRCRPHEPDADDHKHCLNDIVRYCSAPCIGKISREDYLARVEAACAFLRGERPDMLNELQQAMEDAAQSLDFERAAALRDTLLLLRRALRERSRGLKDLSLQKDEARQGLAELQSAFALAREPRIIEAFDISNISGTSAVGSLVCAEDGVPARRHYRMFHIKTVAGSNDPAMMAEVVRRRYERVLREQSRRPDLVLVDGGVAQLRAARRVLDELGLNDLPAAGLAKRFEELHFLLPNGCSRVVRLPLDSAGLKVLRRLRDEAHRFAIRFHRATRWKRLRASLLDGVEGLGEKKKIALLRHFGSLARLRKASEADMAAVPGIGPVLAKRIRNMLAPSN